MIISDGGCDDVVMMVVLAISAVRTYLGMTQHFPEKFCSFSENLHTFPDKGHTTDKFTILFKFRN